VIDDGGSTSTKQTQYKTHVRDIQLKAEFKDPNSKAW